MYNILNAVRFIHSAGVMHRDFKPANILINDECQIEICDFGLSRCVLNTKPNPIVKKELKVSNITLLSKYDKPSRVFHKKRLSQCIGSRWYRSPEIILMQQDYDSQIDIWSVGCIFAELILSFQKEKHIILFPGTSCFPISKTV